MFQLMCCLPGRKRSIVLPRVRFLLVLSHHSGQVNNGITEYFPHYYGDLKKSFFFLMYHFAINMNWYSIILHHCYSWRIYYCYIDTYLPSFNTLFQKSRVLSPP